MIVFVLIIMLNTTLITLPRDWNIRTYVSDFEGLTIKLFLESPELL